MNSQQQRLDEIKSKIQERFSKNGPDTVQEDRKDLIDLLKEWIALAHYLNQPATEGEGCSKLSWILSDTAPQEAIKYAGMAISLIDGAHPNAVEVIAQAHDATAQAYLHLGREIKARQHRAKAVQLVETNPAPTYSSVMRGWLYSQTALADNEKQTINLEKIGGLEEWLNSKSVIKTDDLSPGFGGYITNDRGFCRVAADRLRLLLHKLEAGLFKPENILLEAEPGSGKSFFVKQFASQIPGAHFLERNLSAYNSLDDAFADIVLDVIIGLVSQKTVVLFVDEVDSELNGQYVFQRLIAPMNGDEFFFLKKQVSFAKRNLIVFYAMSSTSDEIRTKKKGEDFISRIPQHHRIKLPSLNDPIDKVYRSVSVLSRKPFAIRRIEAAALLYIAVRKWRSSRELEQALELAKARVPADEHVLMLEHAAVSPEDVLEVEKASKFDIFAFPDRIIEIG